VCLVATNSRSIARIAETGQPSAIGSPVVVFYCKRNGRTTEPDRPLPCFREAESKTGVWSVELRTMECMSEWQLQSSNLNSQFTRLMVIPPCTEFSPRHHYSVTELLFRSISTTGPACLTVSCYSIVALSSSAPSTFGTNSNVAYSRYIIYQVF